MTDQAAVCVAPRTLVAVYEEMEHRCRSSVVECMARFPNVHEYIAQLEKERDSYKEKAWKYDELNR